MWFLAIGAVVVKMDLSFLFLIFLRNLFRNKGLLCIFLKNLFCKTNKIKINKLQIWVGDICTLRCKHCSQLFPFLKEHKLYNIDEQIKYLDKILSVCDVNSLHIIGGEPYTNKDIYKLIEYVAIHNKGKKNKIISNGTIIPDKNTTKYLKKYKNDIFTTVSYYECKKEHQNKFIQHFKDNGIPCFVIDDDLASWFFMGTNTQKRITSMQVVKNNFSACWDRTCYTLADGELSLCPRMHNSYKIFNHKKPFFEYIPAKLIHNNKIGKALLQTVFDSTQPREACFYCYGLSTINKCKVPRGEQIV